MRRYVFSEDREAFVERASARSERGEGANRGVVCRNLRGIIFRTIGMLEYDFNPYGTG